METVSSILTRNETSDGFADSASSDDEDHPEHNAIYPALASSMSDVSNKHGFPGFLGSRLGSESPSPAPLWPAAFARVPRNSLAEGYDPPAGPTGLLDRIRSFWRPPRPRRAPDAFNFNHRGLPECHSRTQTPRMALVVEFLRVTLCSSWLNALLVFVPVGYVSYLRGANPTLTFAFNALAIVPLSALTTDATERIASHTGDTIGAILNISLGNLVELILFVALRNNQIRVVQSSILGSILVNLLLILGSALLACSLPDQEFTHYTAGTQLLGCLLFVSVFALLMPTAFDHTFKDADGAETASLKMSRISAVMVLLIYVAYFVHEIKHHPRTRDAATSSGQDEENIQATPPPSLLSGFQPLPPRTVRFADEDSAREGQPRKASNQTELDDLGAPDTQTNDERDFGASSFHSPSQRARRQSRSLSLSSSRGRLSREPSMDGERAELIRPYLTTRQILRDSRVDADGMSLESNRVPCGPKISRTVSALMLVISSALMSVSAEFLASTIDDVTHQGHLSESLIGLIVVPIVGNVAEYTTVVTVATRDKMGLALAVSVGSSIQIALCVSPLTVMAGWIMDRGLVLAFSLFEVATLLGSVLLVNFLILGEGISGPLRSSRLKGGLMCACYVIIGLGAYLSPLNT